MNFELTDGQVEKILEHRLIEINTEQEQLRYARMVFARCNSIDPTVALKAVIKQVASEHGMTKKHLMELLK